MVTAGVYLIARTHGLFLMAPEILHLVGIVGAITLVLSGFAAMVQTDIKRVLAYSTMSQIGYMFLALGVQAWDAAIFHLMTHAFFKALLFLSSGSVILACHHEQNIFKMGGLRKTMPLVYLCFLVGGAALSALPVITAGFYSKDAILWGALAHGNYNLELAGMVGAFLTSIYTFRMIFIVFHGPEQIKAQPSFAASGIGVVIHLYRRPDHAASERRIADHRRWGKRQNHAGNRLRASGGAGHTDCRRVVPRPAASGEIHLRQRAGPIVDTVVVQCLGIRLAI
jgi:NADH-quinone oxidoreductase subunit L